MKNLRRLKRITHIKSIYALLLIIVTGFCGCDIINPDETIPAYIYIESIEVINNPDLQGKEGSLNNTIVDAWVSANGKLVGAFELPAVIPVLAEGDIEIFTSKLLLYFSRWLQYIFCYRYIN